MSSKSLHLAPGLVLTWGVAERARFVTDFAKRLLQVNTEPVMMVLEEADAFIPQRPAKGEEAMLGAMDRLVRWGRGSGVGCTIVTQRSAKVNKDVTTQAETLIAFRTTGPQDRDAIDGWIKHHAGDERREEVLSTLPALPTGTAWVWSPEWLEFFGQAKFPRRATFDSAATPKVGQKVRPPKELAAVDLEQLRTQMAATIEQAKAEDPRELRKTIAELKKQLTAKQPPPAPAEKGKTVEKFILKDSQIERLEKLFDRVSELQSKFHPMMAAVYAPITAQCADIIGALAKYAPIPRPNETRAPRVTNGSGVAGLSRMHRAMLIALAQHPKGLTKKQIHVHTGYASSGSTSAAFADLIREGWAAAGGYSLTITIAGLTALGDFEPLPLGDDLRAWLLAGDKLSTMEKALLERICAVYPETITKGEILAQAKYASSGSTSAAFAKLVAYHYAMPQGASVLKAATELFS